MALSFDKKVLVTLFHPDQLLYSVLNNKSRTEHTPFHRWTISTEFNNPLFLTPCQWSAPGQRRSSWMWKCPVWRGNWSNQRNNAWMGPGSTCFARTACHCCRRFSASTPCSMKPKGAFCCLKAWARQLQANLKAVAPQCGRPVERTGVCLCNAFNRFFIKTTECVRYAFPTWYAEGISADLQLVFECKDIVGADKYFVSKVGVILGVGGLLRLCC